MLVAKMKRRLQILKKCENCVCLVGFFLEVGGTIELTKAAEDPGFQKGN